MADIKYKKGGLLLEETFETVKESEEDEVSQAMKIVSTTCTEDVVIIDFNGTEYTCLAIVHPAGFGIMYGGFDIDNYKTDFTTYPFVFMSGEAEGQHMAQLCTENPGTYTIKIYTAIEDSDSTESNPVITYLMTSPSNTNWNVLSSMLGDGDWSELKAYVEATPHNMNRMVLESLLSGGNSNVVGSAVVGTAVAG